MKTGDLVKWVGFSDQPVLEEEKYGIIVRTESGVTFQGKEKRLYVLWGSGRMGMGLFPCTIEVIQ